MESLWGAGVFGVELFLMKDGSVLLNEIAPRYDVEACTRMCLHVGEEGGVFCAEFVAWLVCVHA